MDADGRTDDKSVYDDARGREYGDEVAKALKRARQRRGYTQKKLAEMTGLSVNTISNFERNKTRIPAYIIKVYCDALDVSADEILRTGKEFLVKGKAKAVAAELPDLPDQYLDGLLGMIRTHKKGKMIRKKDDKI